MFAWSFYAAAAGLPAFAALYWKKATTAGILSGMIAGFTVCIGWKLAGLPFGLGATVPGAIACAAALVIVSLATYKKSPSPFLDPAVNTFFTFVSYFPGAVFTFVRSFTSTPNAFVT